MQTIKEIFREAGELRESITGVIGYESPQLMREFAARRNAAEQRLEAGETESLTITESRRIGRNDPCPCGSGYKFKKCCGVNFRDNDPRLKD